MTVESKEENKDDDKAVADEVKQIKDSFGRTIKAPENKEDSSLKDSYGRNLKAAEKKEEPKEVKMIAGTDKKKTSVDDEND